jgi:hypothetical protein
MTPTETKDLLIKAARANGLEGEYVEGADGFSGYFHQHAYKPDGSRYWCPLTTPGDCFIACAKLGIDLDWYSDFVRAQNSITFSDTVEKYADHLTPGRTLDESKVAAACMAAVRCMAMLADEASDG